MLSDRKMRAGYLDDSYRSNNSLTDDGPNTNNSILVFSAGQIFFFLTKAGQMVMSQYLNNVGFFVG